MAEESIVEYEIDDTIKTNEDSKYEVADAIEIKDSEYEVDEPIETKENDEYEVTDTIKTTESNEYEIGDTHDTRDTDDTKEESNPPDEVEENVLGTKEYDESGVNLDLPQIQESENSAVVNAEKRWPGWPGENVFRMLVPVQKVGSIIGRKGEYIKKITEETRARIKILDGPPGTLERAVMVSGKEEPDVAIPPAMDGLLRVHKRIIDLDSDTANEGAGGVVSTRLLVADTQAGSLIGKQGSTIKSIQDDSGCTIRVLGAEHLPLFSLQGDSLVEVQGESAGVHKAVELILTHLRKFLVDRSIIGLFETQMQMPNARAIPDTPRHDSWGQPQGFSMGAGGGHGYAPSSQYMQQPGPPRHFNEYYPSSDMPPLEKQTRPSAYGREAAMGIHSSGAQAQSSMITKVTQHMQIPLSYADAVIGTSGANISYIRRASGATIAIQETRGLPGEMTVEICGSAAQIQTAQQLIQNFMAEAASSKQNPSSGSAGQGYNSYPTQSSMYASPSSDLTGHAGYIPPGDYGQTNGSNYGY